MFIYHFNRLIRNRILWGFFAIIIAIAFVAVDSCYRSPMEGRDVGSLNGKTISYLQFDQVVRGIRGVGRNRDNETPAHIVDRRAWEQLAAVALAKKNGMGVTPQEIRDELRNNPAFQGPNGFDMNRYTLVLRDQGMTPATFEAMVAHQLAMMKCGVLADSSTWVSPMELEDELASMTDKFTVQVVSISNAFVNADLKLTDADLKKYYEENKESFALPEQVQVRYVEVPVSNYLASVKVSEAELQDFYDSNVDQYTRTTTNNTTETIPFEQVRTNIVQEMSLEAARYTASTSLSFQIYADNVDTNKDILAEFAKAKNLKIKTSPLFGANDRLFWAEDSAKVSEGVFELDPEVPEMRFTVVDCKNLAYVIELVKRVPAHTPSLKDAMADVRSRALTRARHDAFDKKIKESREALEKSLKAGKTFADAARAQSLNVSTSITYSCNEIQNTKFDNSYQIAYGAMGVQKGGISEGIPASISKSLLVYVQDRVPGDAMALEMVRTQLRSNLHRRGGSHFAERLKWNLSKQDFEPSRPLLPEDTKLTEDGTAIEGGLEEGDQGI